VLSEGIFYSSLLIMTLALAALCLMALFPCKVSIKNLTALWLVFIISLAVISFYSEPGGSDDLFRHYYNISRYRSGRSFQASGVIGFEAILWIISRTPSNGWLPFFSVLAFGLLIKKLAYDYAKQEDEFYRANAVALYFIAALGGCTVFYLISGIRTSLICAIWVYNYHFYYYSKKSKYYIIQILSCTIHAIGFLLLLITIVYDSISNCKSKRVRVIIFAFCLLIISASSYTTLFVPILKATGINYLQYIASKWNAYRSNMQVAMELNIRVKTITYLALFACANLRNRKKDNENGLMSFLILIAFAVGGIPVLFDRLGYAIGILSYHGLYDTTIRARGGKGTFRTGVALLLIAQLLIGYYELFAHISFNGIFFRDIIRYFG